MGLSSERKGPPQDRKEHAVSRLPRSVDPGGLRPVCSVRRPFRLRYAADVKKPRPRSGSPSPSRTGTSDPGAASSPLQLVAQLERAAIGLLRRGKRDEALSLYQQAFAAAPDTTLGGLCGVQALVMQNRASEAEERVRRLIARAPSNGKAHLMLGNVLSEVGRFDEAVTHLERAIALAPSVARAPWVAMAYPPLVNSRRLTEADRPLIARILSLLETGDAAMPADVRVALHFAAGKALDDLKDYAGAIRHFDSAHEVRRRHAPPFDREAFAQGTERVVARYTSRFFARNTHMGDRDETPVLVLGMPRSGTTLVERIVSSHPKIGGGGELQFWTRCGEAMVSAPNDKLDVAAHRIRSEYLRLLRGISPDALRVTDKMPYNFLWIGLAHLFFPKARIIHCRRNPMDICLSIYTNHLFSNSPYAQSREDLAFYYRQYLTLMGHWRTVLPAERLLEVDYEDMTTAPEAVAKRVVAFCGLDWDAACLHPERNPNTVQTASIWQARQPIYRSSVERWRNYEPWLGELLELLPQST
jgi:tetratricopeptide (TPR) repeat protein